MLLELQRDSDYDIINEIGSGDEKNKQKESQRDQNLSSENLNDVADKNIKNVSVASEEDSGNLNYVEDQQEVDDSSSDQGDIPMHEEDAENNGGKLFSYDNYNK